MDKINLEEIRRAQIKLKYDYYLKNRVNFSKQADDILEKVKQGLEINDKEVFILFCDDINQINKYSYIYDIKQKVKNNELTEEDLYDLCCLVFGSGTVECQTVYDSFINSKIIEKSKK